MLKSLKQNRTGILLMFLSSISVCMGQMFWKLASTGGVINLFPGFALYGFGAIIMLIAYKFGSLSVLQPMISISYILTILIARYILGEDITVLKLMGILVIIFGIVMIGGGDD